MIHKRTKRNESKLTQSIVHWRYGRVRVQWRVEQHHYPAVTFALVHLPISLHPIPLNLTTHNLKIRKFLPLIIYSSMNLNMPFKVNIILLEGQG